MTDAEIADILDKAHDELLTRGWSQGSLMTPCGRVCSIGALACAKGVQVHCGTLTADAASALGRETEALAAQIGDRSLYGADVSVALWNDDIDRTEDEVFDLFRNTAKKLRES